MVLSTVWQRFVAFRSRHNEDSFPRVRGDRLDSPQPERRKHPRVQAVLKVEYQRPADLLEDYITDLSEGGIFIRTSLPLEVGQQIQFSLSFPGLLEPVNLVGVVRWRRETTDDDEQFPTGIGVEFLFSDDNARQQLRALVGMLKDTVMIGTAPDRPFRVLLLEDNELIQEMFRYAVKQFHFQDIKNAPLEIFGASHGQEALEIARTESIDLAIIDHFLPGITGAAVVEQMRADPRTRNVPVLVVSGGGEEVKQEALRVGADLFLDKPVMMKQLVATIRALVAKHLAHGGAPEDTPR